MIIGVLAFQGDFAEHREILTSLGVLSIEVRSLAELARVDGLIIPGGESTVIAKFLEESGMGKEIIKRVKAEGQKGRKGEKAGRGEKAETRPLFVFGTCAGAILLARKVRGKNAPRTLGLIDIDLDRNAYGSQRESFEATVNIQGKSINTAFIRAPKVTRVGKAVEVLGTLKGEPVLVKQGRVLASMFHPEARHEVLLHRIFLRMISKNG